MSRPSKLQAPASQPPASPPPAYDPPAFKSFEHGGWERIATSYGDSVARVTVQCVPHILDAVGVRKGLRVLDVASGPGFLTQAAAERGAEALGLDFSESMVQEARRRFPHVAFRQGDGENLPFGEGSYDVVLCAFGILHFANPDRAIAEAHRVLVPGGVYALTAWRPLEENAFFNLVLEAIKTHGNLNVPVPPGPPMFRFGDPAECERVLRGAGFHDVSTRGLPAFLHLDRPEEALEMIEQGTVRTVAVLKGQTPAQRERIEQAVIAATDKYRLNGKIALPMPVVLALGRK